MTNIQRQQATVAKLVAILAKGYDGATNMQLSSVRRRHAAAMLKIGYSPSEATASARECSDIALLEVEAL